MRRIRTLLPGLALGLLTLGSASAEEVPEQLPWNILEHAAEGDWIHLRARLTQKPEKPETSSRFVVKKVEGGSVTLLSKYDSKTLQKSDGTRMTTLLDMLGMASPSPRCVGSAEEKKKFGDRELTCVKLTFELKKGDPATRAVVWLSKEVKAPHVVALDLASVGRHGAATATLAGYGSGDRVDWGKAAPREDSGRISATLFAPGAPVVPTKAKTTKGREVDLAKLEGLVLLHFASSWDDAAHELATLNAYAKAYGPHGLTIVLVASIEARDVTRWGALLEKHGVTVDAIADTDGKIESAWQIERTEVGGWAPACVTYLMEGGKVVDGEWRERDARLSVARVLGERWKDVPLPEPETK